MPLQRLLAYPVAAAKHALCAVTPDLLPDDGVPPRLEDVKFTVARPVRKSEPHASASSALAGVHTDRISLLVDKRAYRRLEPQPARLVTIAFIQAEIPFEIHDGKIHESVIIEIDDLRRRSPRRAQIASGVRPPFPFRLRLAAALPLYGDSLRLCHFRSAAPLASIK